MKAIAEMYSEYGCEWPPQPDFVSWPASWMPYQTIADLIAVKLHGTEPGDFRLWLMEELEKTVSIVSYFVN